MREGPRGPKPKPKIIAPHGGYEKLKSFQMAEIVYDGTVAFCDRFVPPRSRTHDQMVQAARSGKQNISEGSQVSGTSRKMELKLVGVARASLEELRQDYLDFLRTRGLAIWGKNSQKALAIRRLAYAPARTYRTYRSYVEGGSPEVAANTMLCLLGQACYLLDRQLRALERQFAQQGGFTERLYHARRAARDSGQPPEQRRRATE